MYSNIVPRHDHHSKKPFPRPVFSHVFNSYFQTFHHTKAPIWRCSKGLSSVVPSFRSVIPSLPYFAFVYIPTIQKLSPFQQTVFSQTWFRQITQSTIHQSTIHQSAIHQSQHSIKKPIFLHSTIPLFQKRCWRSDIMSGYRGTELYSMWLSPITM